MPDMTITFFNTEEFGFYKHGTTDLLFGAAGDALSELQAWAEGKDVGMTELASPSKRFAGALPVYIFGVQPTHGTDWLLATWNSMPSGGGKIASMARKSTVGQAPEVHENPVVEGTIPGFPTYFWFVPERNVFASLRFENPVTAVQPMLGYLRQFLKTESGYVVKDGDGAIVGYRELNGNGDHTKAHAKISASVRTKPGAVQHLKAVRNDIRCVVRDSYLTQRKRLDRNVFQRAAQFLRGSTDKSDFTQDAKVHVELKYTPTAAELDQMIDTELATPRETEFDDLGFKLSGSNETIWINSALSRNTVNTNLVIPENGVVPIADLAAILIARRAEFLRGM